MKTGYSVADCMTQKPLTVGPKITLKQCATLMKNNSIGSILVIEKGKPIGILTNQDIVFRVVAEGVDFNMPVKKFMSSEVIMIPPEMDIFEALEVMNKNVIRHISVAKDNKLVGYLTLKDILRIEPALFDLYMDKIDSWMGGNNNASPICEKEGLCELCGDYTQELINFNSMKVCKKCKKDN